MFNRLYSDAKFAKTMSKHDQINCNDFAVKLNIGRFSLFSITYANPLKIIDIDENQFGGWTNSIFPHLHFNKEIRFRGAKFRNLNNIPTMDYFTYTRLKCILIKKN